MEAIAVNGLTKYYGKKRGVEELSFSVPQGTVFGFLGPNGAGKTTTIRILLDVVRPDSGEIYLFGEQVKPGYPAAIRHRIGYLPGELRLYEEMTGQRYLDLLGAFYGKIDPRYRQRLCQALELAEADLARPLNTYSHGMKQKVGIIYALQHNPDLIILDEPTEGLDPLIRNRFYQLLGDLVAEGKTVFMSSHNLAEVEKSCSQVAIMRNGHLLVTQAVAELKAMRLYRIDVEFADNEAAEAFRCQGAEIEGAGRQRTLRWRGDFSQLFAALGDHSILDFTCQKAPLEEIFLTYYEDEGERQ